MVDMTYEKGMHYADILRLAMKREEKALALYNELQGKTDKDEYIRLFKILAQEEAKHKKFLETMYDDYMAEQGD
jgi:rubrerythrin